MAILSVREAHGMNRPHPNEPSVTGCLVQSVAAALRAEPSLEAVTIDLARQSIDVATLGATADLGLAGRVVAQIEQMRAAGPAQRCGLLSGRNDCHACDRALPPEIRNTITIKQEAGATTIARVTCPTAPKFWRWKNFPLPKVLQRDVEFFEEEEHPHEWKWQLLAAGLCGALALTAAFLSPGPARLGLFVLAYLAGSWFTAQEVWERLRKAAIDVHFLMLTVAAGSAAIGNWAEGATLLFLFSLSGGLEHFAMARTRREIDSLFKSAPKTATLLDADGHEREVPVGQVRPGARLLVKPGGQFPVDAEIVKGATAGDESNLTGEATPVEKAVGDTVLAGTLNLWGAVETVVLRPAAESALQKIIRLIQDAQQQKAPAQRFTDQFSSVYTYVVLALSLVMFFVWWLGFQLPPFSAAGPDQSAFYRAMTLLVVASPCALVLSIPSAVLAAIAWGARHGILFRGGAAVEKLAEIQIVALDKTGTLTTGELKVERVESFPPGREHEVAVLAFSLERLSTHPLARAITRHGKQQSLQPVGFDHFESITGQGLLGRRGNATCFLGRREAVAFNPHSDQLARVPVIEAGLSEVWLSEGELLGRIILRDDIRPQARAALEGMRAAGLQTLVLTGDHQSAADFLKTQLPLDDIRAGLKPEQKVAAIQAFAHEGRRVAMVGDGVNDAPSLAAAHVGVAMGARGSDAALEQAEVVLMHDRLENFLTAFRLSQRARAIIRQNQVISLGTVVVLVGFALAGGIPLTIGVVGHEGSTVIVVMNSLRLLFGNVAATPHRRR